MKPTPTQLRKLADLLSQPADDVDTLAENVWDLVVELQNARERWLLIAWHPKVNVMQAIGPYATYNQAAKDAANRIADSGGTQVKGVRLVDPDTIDITGQTMIDEIKKRKKE